MREHEQIFGQVLVPSVTSQERRLSFNSLELIQGGTQATPRVKTARIPWKSLALARPHPKRIRFLTLPTKVPSGSLGRIGSLKGTSDKSLFPMALGSYGHRITHQLRPINMNGRSILSETSFLDYCEYRRNHLPIGSGVTEAACKTVFTQRLKQSGTTWSLEGGQWIVDLRVVHLSGIWPQVYQGYLQAKNLPEMGTQEGSRKKKPRKAA